MTVKGKFQIMLAMVGQQFFLVSGLDVCVTVHHQCNDVNNQQDATTFSFINLFK
jgi:hypothetical protein